MGRYRLTAKAAKDIEAIAQTSLEQWGITRTEAYIFELHAAFQRLAEFPGMGQASDHIRTGYMRLNLGSHLVFYQRVKVGVRIVRILHQRMDFERHL